MMAELFPGAALFLLPFSIVAVAVFAVVAVATARREPDPAGTRPYAIYLSLVLFVAVFIALFAATAVMQNVVRIPLNDAASLELRGASRSIDDLHTARAIEAGLVVLAALAVMWFHVRRLRELVQEPQFNTSPGRRTYQVYLHAVSFVSLVTLLFAGAFAVYGLVRALAPATTGPLLDPSYERGGGIAEAFTAGFLAVASYVVFWYHWHRTRTLRGAAPVSQRGGRHAGPPRPPAPLVEDDPPPVAPPT